MKKSLSLSLFFISIVLLLSSCKKDDSNFIDYGDSYIIIGATTFRLGTQGYIDNYGAHDGVNTNFVYTGFNLDLHIVESSIKLIFNPSGELITSTGEGLTLYFEAFSTDSAFFSNDVYVLDTISPHLAPSFTIGEYCLSTSTSTGATDCHAFKAGTYSVSRDNDTYTISFNLIDDQGVEVKGTYKGILMMQGS